MNVTAADGPHAATFADLRVYEHRHVRYTDGVGFRARYTGGLKGRALSGGTLDAGEHKGRIAVSRMQEIEMRDPREWIEMRKVGDGYEPEDTQ